MANKNRPDGTGETGRGNQHDAEIRDDDLERRRRELEASLATRLPNRLEDGGSDSAGNVALVFRFASEFVAGVLVGGLIGWGLDWLLGSSPIFLIVFLLGGFGAALTNMVRVAKAAQAKVPLGKDLPAGSVDDEDS
ncbi:AtpZ/AtpI family protein [Mesorhizobium comanense]|uniref:AtpZ/AtpI family protein n=1 Tax=Mesorhizobium comanense TaxID=2502215 RepID=UPI0010F73A00|nr:AtpZ/AtpI family protein [Mesorhizobium comanense]